jgi:hypothetical protein
MSDKITTIVVSGEGVAERFVKDDRCWAAVPGEDETC